MGLLQHGDSILPQWSSDHFYHHLTSTSTANCPCPASSTISGGRHMMPPSPPHDILYRASRMSQRPRLRRQHQCYLRESTSSKSFNNKSYATSPLPSPMGRTLQLGHWTNGSSSSMAAFTSPRSHHFYEIFCICCSRKAQSVWRSQRLADTHRQQHTPLMSLPQAFY